MQARYIIAAALAASLAACGGEPAEEVAVDEGDCPPGINASGGWMSLAAIEGDPSAVYFELENTNERNVMIRAASVSGYEMAALHQVGEWNLQPSMDELMQVDVPAGETVVFEPETMHVMAMQPDGTQEVGGEAEATLTFVGGDKCSFPVEIRAPGDAPGAATGEGEEE
ncbi:copper chaperone PCu(A)C [Aurantiacibacter poecillastricola]|uniref:copper chaperone PCu(A)C n=1 Tax=Aurantiacibacter poecillastricola TaxID=3064385 RepID=UPI00273E586A|nr:copper chaperone PCu(A)C [Aurantiacibacter sp. 219JJ12-13]MDP5262017.1 copper chaperone PCu(A)C [Aurantiacibacter sp. 219JJ12-13]